MTAVRGRKLDIHCLSFSEKLQLNDKRFHLFHPFLRGTTKLCTCWHRVFLYCTSHPCCRPVLLGYMYGHHLQWFQTLDHPAMPLADPGCLHTEEGVWHPAPQHSHDGLHIQSWRALRHRVPVLTLKYGRRERHRILGKEER